MQILFIFLKGWSWNALNTSVNCCMNIIRRLRWHVRSFRASCGNISQRPCSMLELLLVTESSAVRENLNINLGPFLCSEDGKRACLSVWWVSAGLIVQSYIPSLTAPPPPPFCHPYPLTHSCLVSARHSSRLPGVTLDFITDWQRMKKSTVRTNPASQTPLLVPFSCHRP